MAAFPDAAEGVLVLSSYQADRKCCQEQSPPPAGGSVHLPTKHRTVFHYFPLFPFCRGTFSIPCSSFRAECGWEPGISERGQILPHKIRTRPAIPLPRFLSSTKRAHKLGVRVLPVMKIVFNYSGSRNDIPLPVHNNVPLRNPVFPAPCIPSCFLHKLLREYPIWN